jgi:cytochrome c biogenesis protein CcmG/thiol:disulfide interchange protein DsbE
MSSRLRYLIPLFIFLVMAAFLAKGLFMAPKFIPSVLVNKPAPAFSLPSLKNPEQKIDNASMKGKVWLLNVWASWCVSCRAEHEVLLTIARMGIVDIYGLNYKDEARDAHNWLRQLGDPYVANLVDREGRTGIDLGVYGVPESFLIDEAGVIRYKFTGPLHHEDIKGILIPELEKIKAPAK